MIKSVALELKDDLFRGFYLGGNVMLAFSHGNGLQGWQQQSRIEHIGNWAYATLDISVVVRLA